jgi:hypothetical protein
VRQGEHRDAEEYDDRDSRQRRGHRLEHPRDRRTGEHRHQGVAPVHGRHAQSGRSTGPPGRARADRDDHHRDGADRHGDRVAGHQAGDQGVEHPLIVVVRR